MTANRTIRPNKNSIFVELKLWCSFPSASASAAVSSSSSSFSLAFFCVNIIKIMGFHGLEYWHSLWNDFKYKFRNWLLLFSVFFFHDVAFKWMHTNGLQNVNKFMVLTKAFFTERIARFFFFFVCCSVRSNFQLLFAREYVTSKWKKNKKLSIQFMEIQFSLYPFINGGGHSALGNLQLVSASTNQLVKRFFFFRWFYILC